MLTIYGLKDGDDVESMAVRHGQAETKGQNVNLVTVFEAVLFMATIVMAEGDEENTVAV